MRDESDDYKLPADDSIRVEREMEEINKKKKKEKEKRYALSFKSRE